MTMELALQLGAVMLLLLIKQWSDVLPDCLELLQRGATVLAAFLDPRLNLCLEGGHPHHEELIEIVAEDGAELRLFQQWSAFIQCLDQHPFVEGDPAEFPIDVEIGGENFVTHRVTCGA